MAEPREPRNVDYALGRIEAQLAMITQTLSEDRMAAAQYRTDVRRQLADTGEKLGAVSGDLHSAKEDIAEMKPKVVSLEQRALMSKGAAQFAVLLGKFGHILIAAAGGGVAILLERWLRR